MLGVRSERPAKQPLFGLRSDCSRLAYNSAPSDRSERSFNFWDCTLGIWSAVGVQFRYLGVQSESNLVVWECNLSAIIILLLGSAI